LLVEAMEASFVVVCVTGAAALGGALEARCGVARRAFVAGRSRADVSANFGSAATAFKNRKQKAGKTKAEIGKAESRNPDGETLKAAR
ncbi:MAG: hypothetical protein NT167_28480, partial [Verrucomicrobia bacterium]|nr:hypothetical protein [Verrucomicrobiota bacterium]